jgi:thiamine biosynthesis lipoprotein ApbE
MALTQQEVNQINELYKEIDSLKEINATLAVKAVELSTKVVELAEQCTELTSLQTGKSSATKTAKRKKVPA